MDTGLTRKVFNLLSDESWSSISYRDSCVERGLFSLKTECSELGGEDNRELEGDFSLMQNLGQRLLDVQFCLLYSSIALFRT